MGLFPIHVGIIPIDLIRALVSRGDTLAGLERLLQLSPGYLSKVRRQAAVPSPQLVALLELLVQHPEVRATLVARAAAPRAAPSRRDRPRAHAVPPSFLRKLAVAWRASKVRFHAVDDLLLEALGVPAPKGLEPSLRFLVHPRDRHALAGARALGAEVALASSNASVCTPEGGSASVIFVFPLEPLHHLFEKSSVSAIDAALYFALQADDDADARLRAIARTHVLPRAKLERSFADTYRAAPALPQKEWLLRAMFDPELARKRLAELP